MDLSGKGDEEMWIAAYGVQYMPSQWGVLDEENKNLTMIKLKSPMKYFFKEKTIKGNLLNIWSTIKFELSWMISYKNKFTDLKN